MTFDVKSKELDISTEGNTSHSCRILSYVNHVRMGHKDGNSNNLNLFLPTFKQF
jgi:hypothetical protein